MKINPIKYLLLILTLVLLPYHIIAGTLQIQNTSLADIQYVFTPGFPGFPGFPPTVPPMPGFPANFAYRAMPSTIPFPGSIDLTGIDTLVITWTAPEGQKFVVTPPTSPDYTNSVMPSLSFGVTYDGVTSNLPPIINSTYSWSGLSGNPVFTSKSDFVSPNYITLGYRFRVADQPISFTSFTQTITFSNNATGTFTLNFNSFLTYSASGTFTSADPYPTNVTDGLVFTTVSIPTITIAQPEISGGNISITWNGIPGSTYRLQSTPSLNVGETLWTDASSNITATNTTPVIAKPVDTTQKFYRIMLVN